MKIHYSHFVGFLAFYCCVLFLKPFFLMPAEASENITFPCGVYEVSGLFEKNQNKCKIRLQAGTFEEIEAVFLSCPQVPSLFGKKNWIQLKVKNLGWSKKQRAYLFQSLDFLPALSSSQGNTVNDRRLISKEGQKCALKS